MERLKRLGAGFGSLAAVGTHTPRCARCSRSHLNAMPHPKLRAIRSENTRTGTDLDEYGIWRASCSGSRATNWSALK